MRRLLELQKHSAAIRRELDRIDDETFVPSHIDKAQTAADAEIELIKAEVQMMLEEEEES